MLSLRENAYLTLGAVLPSFFFGHGWVGILNLLLGLYMLRIDKHRFDIISGGKLYLSRWHLFRANVARAFVHQIFLADQDRHLHNHPWPNAWGFVLWGGYTEVRINRSGCVEVREIKRWHFNRLYPETYHRIVSVRPNTWTLFVAGRRTRDWGFLVDGVHIPYRTYLDFPESHVIED